MYELFDANYCQYRLPCGLCMRTNSPCAYSKTVVTVATGTTTINDTNSSVVNIPNCELRGGNNIVDYFEVARKATNFDILSSLCQGNTNFIEIGCFAKALTQGIYATMYGLPKGEDKVIFLNYCEIGVGRDQENHNRITNNWGDHEFSFYYLKDYGNTWAFTEEELRGTNDTTSRN